MLHPLQRGDLVVYDGTRAVPRDFWTDKNPHYIRASTRFLFRRKDVLALWPDPRRQVSWAPPPIASLRGARAEAITRSEGREMSGTPIDLVPLEIIHADAYEDSRDLLMRRVEAELRGGTLALWGYHKGERGRGSKSIPLPLCYGTRLRLGRRAGERRRRELALSWARILL